MDLELCVYMYYKGDFMREENESTHSITHKHTHRVYLGVGVYTYTHPQSLLEMIVKCSLEGEDSGSGVFCFLFCSPCGKHGQSPPPLISPNSNSDTLFTMSMTGSGS